jgi:phosphorylcholine metabolism protein LicD
MVTLSFENWLLNEGRMAVSDWSKEDHEEFNKLRLKNLADACALCDKYKVRYWLDCGTLLGFYRDKKMIDGDSDNDIGIFAEDITPEFLEAIADHARSTEGKSNFFQPGKFPDFEDENAATRPLSLKYHSLDKNRQVKFKGKLIWTDLFVYYPHKDYHLYMLSRNYFRVKSDHISSFKTLTYEGTKFKIPSKVEPYLENVFGKGWSEPDPNYISSAENKGFYVIPKKEHGEYSYNWKKKEGKLDDK